MNDNFIWIRYTTGDDPCEQCLALEGIYENFRDIPSDPHPHCNCQIDGAMRSAVKKLAQRTIKRRLPDECERVDVIGKGITGSSSVSVAITSSETLTGGVSVGGKIGEITVTGTYSEATMESRTGTGMVSKTFAYREDIGGEIQYVFALYKVWEVKTVTDLLVGGGTRVEETDIEIYRELAGYKYVNGDSYMNDADEAFASGSGTDDSEMPDGDTALDDDMPDGDADLDDIMPAGVAE